MSKVNLASSFLYDMLTLVKRLQDTISRECRRREEVQKVRLEDVRGALAMSVSFTCYKMGTIGFEIWNS